MTVPLSMMVAICLLSTVIGFLSAVVFQRFFRHRKQLSSAAATPTVPSESPDLNLLPALIDSLFELTAHVGTQVSEHSTRVGEITKTIGVNESRETLASTLVLAAGQLLITANQKLQLDLEEARKEIQLQQDQLNECLRESRTDALTQLPNRRALDQEIVRAFAQNRRRASAFSLILIDIDHFKRVNDGYGHMVGDQLLKSISQRLRSTFRETDFVARFGGDEFVGILFGTRLEDACEASERIRKEIAASSYKIGEYELPITASIGVKEFQFGESEEELFKKVDQALYAAKNGGRNCCFYHDGRICVRVSPRLENANANIDLKLSHRIESAHGDYSEGKTERFMESVVARTSS